MAEIIIKESALVKSLLEDKLKEIDQLIRDNKFTVRDDSSRGDLTSSVQLAIQDFLNSLQDSATAEAVLTIPYGSINSSSYYNSFWSAVGQDLTALYKEAERIGKMVSDNHNYVTADIQGLLLQLKSANARLASYELYASTTDPNKRTLVENFNDISQLDIGSTFVQDSECAVDTVQGIITLATKGSVLEGIATQEDVESIAISAVNSTGTAFANTSLLKTIASGDFYLFQYEHTSSEFEEYRLVLDFTIKLKTPKIINYIRIVPNNYGTKTWPKILALDISTDGIDLFSIRDALLTDEANDTQFVLAPYTSNYAGEGRYSFLPMEAQYIHVLIEQTSPYFDSIRDLYRWAIGIKNIEIAGKEYADSSQLVSKDYIIPQGISQILIDANEFPRLAYEDGENTNGAEINHEISVDGGMTWKEMSPSYMGGAGLYPEVMYVNSVDGSGLTEGVDHLNSTIESNAVRYRVSMQKNPDLILDPNLIPFYSPVLRRLDLQVITREDL
jgi:hypothetical protein